MKWVSVTDALPKDTTTVLAYEEIEGLVLAHYIAAVESWAAVKTGDRLLRVTHWMQIPQRP